MWTKFIIELCAGKSVNGKKIIKNGDTWLLLMHVNVYVYITTKYLIWGFFVNLFLIRLKILNNEYSNLYNPPIPIFPKFLSFFYKIYKNMI
jgi:hypothetical protein